MASRIELASSRISLRLSSTPAFLLSCTSQAFSH
jgi:hypothetical protein